MFAEKGGNAFRSFKRLGLHQTFTIEDVIVSTGGGTPVFFDNMEIMNERGLCILFTLFRFLYYQDSLKYFQRFYLILSIFLFVFQFLIALV
ncbi:MAG: hypothetical protein PF484_14270 [Bacteroidales bacterium]|nr:hypothetical protein [Bacteroidales bacterium]